MKDKIINIFKKTDNKKILSIMATLIVIMMIIGVFFLYKKNEVNVYSTNLFYMDTYINVKIYTNDSYKANKALKGVEDIYRTYHQLTDRYNGYDNLINIYYINNNEDKIKSFPLDKELCTLLKYGIEWYNKSNGLLNINIGSAIDVWKKYRDAGTGIPSQEELSSITDTDINNIKFESGCTLLNTHPNIDLGSIAKGYTTEMAGDYLKKIGVSKFIINAGGNALVGDHYNNGIYKIGVKDPTDTSKIFTAIKGNNMAVVTSGSYERFYEYNGQIYHHIIDPKTFMPVNYMKSVTIISSSSALADTVDTMLFLMPIDEGMKYVNSRNDMEAIWYGMDGKIYTSKGISKYE